MPRQGVPYPSREICSLKCQIDALQRQINELMKSINGVQGDGQGNVSLVSGDPAVVINNDASQNQIEIALDQSELPAAAVRMVNGMTGAVVLAANDIYAGANTVGFEIADLKAENLLRKQGITNEISNRQAADSALQANINALQASIPGEAAQAVANDPTVQGLVTADAQNVKLSGAQTVGGVKTFTAVPIVPTPAAGSTDGSVPNTNWISQTGDSGPNNLVHRTGNETIAGDKTFTSLIAGRLKKSYTAFGSSNWTLLYTRENSGRTQHLIGYASQSIIIAVISSDTAVYTRVLTTTARQYPQPIMKITKDSNGVIGVWARGFYSATINWVLLENAQYSTEYVTGITAVNSTYSMPVVGATTGYDPNATYTDVYDSEDFPFIR